MNTYITPGPWTVENDEKGDVGVFAPDYGLVCYPVEDNFVANAHAIAAAPEMLDALRGIVETVSVYDVGTSGGRKLLAARIETARAAIAKAEGR